MTLSADAPPADAALLELLRRLSAAGYRFTTPAPVTHRRVLLRRGRVEARGLDDVFGWNLPFRRDAFGADLADLMAEAGILRTQGQLVASALRVASVGRLLFLHAGFPPAAADSVFFGPDSYRFVDFIRAELPALAPGASIVDVGCGAGVGGIFTQSLRPQARLTLADVNPRALRLARINAAFAGQSPRLCESDGLDATVDLVVANPPYIGGATGKTYSDGGGGLGRDVSVAWARAAAARLAPGGRLLMYSGAAIVKGQDGLRQALAAVADAAGFSFSYRELDADVFPATLLHRAYWRVERIAAVGCVIDRPA